MLVYWEGNSHRYPQFGWLKFAWINIKSIKTSRKNTLIFHFRGFSWFMLNIPWVTKKASKFSWENRPWHRTRLAFAALVAAVSGRCTSMLRKGWSMEEATEALPLLGDLWQAGGSWMKSWLPWHGFIFWGGFRDDLMISWRLSGIWWDLIGI